MKYCIWLISVCLHSSFRILFLLFLLIATVYPQDTSQIYQNPERINIYIDSPDWYMDMDYYRTEIPFVNYVRDRADADVHILTTTQQTGGDGYEFTIRFIGLQRFAGQNDTLLYVSQQTDTEDMIRRELARHFKIGLMQYVSHTSVVNRINIDYRQPESEESAAETIVDPWNYWTFRTRLRSSLNGEKSYKYNYINVSVYANRVTELWKYNISLSISNTRRKYDYGNDVSFIDTRRSNYFDGSIVRSLTPHWSLGLVSGASNSTYNNYDLSLYIQPGVEFNVYPYSEATRRQLTIQYLFGAHYYNYHEETIYYKLEEQRFTNSLNIAYEIKQPWGSVSSSLMGSHYFHDIEKFNVSLYSSLDINIAKGLSLDLYGSITYQRDQLSLPVRGASVEEVLTQRQELETDYYYYISGGISYTFGSIYNNVVNPRFGG